MSSLCCTSEVHSDKEYFKPEVASLKRRTDHAVSSIESNLRIVNSLLTGELELSSSRGQVNLETTSVLIQSQIEVLGRIHENAKVLLESMGEHPFCCHKCTEHRVTRVVICLVVPIAGIGGLAATGAELFQRNVDERSDFQKLGILALIGAGLASGRAEAYLERRRAAEMINKTKLESLVDRTQRYMGSAKMLLNVFKSVDYTLSIIPGERKLRGSAAESGQAPSQRAQAEHDAISSPAPTIHASDIPEEFRRDVDATKLTKLAVKYRSLPRGFSPAADRGPPPPGALALPQQDTPARSALPPVSEAGADGDGSVFVPLSSVELSALPASGQTSASPHSPDAVIVTVAEHKQPDPQHTTARTEMLETFARRNTPPATPAPPAATAQPSALSVAGAGQRLRKFFWGT